MQKMTTPYDLENLLDELKIPKDAYSLYSEPRDETLVIQHIDKQWITFYYEHGLKTNMQHYDTQAAAENYFLSELRSWFKI